MTALLHGNLRLEMRRETEERYAKNAILASIHVDFLCFFCSADLAVWTTCSIATQRFTVVRLLRLFGSRTMLHNL